MWISTSIARPYSVTAKCLAQVMLVCDLFVFCQIKIYGRGARFYGSEEESASWTKGAWKKREVTEVWRGRDEGEWGRRGEAGSRVGEGWERLVQGLLTTCIGLLSTSHEHRKAILSTLHRPGFVLFEYIPVSSACVTP